MICRINSCCTISQHTYKPSWSVTLKYIQRNICTAPDGGVLKTIMCKFLFSSRLKVFTVTIQQNYPLYIEINHVQNSSTSRCLFTSFSASFLWKYQFNQSYIMIISGYSLILKPWTKLSWVDNWRHFKAYFFHGLSYLRLKYLNTSSVIHFRQVSLWTKTRRS